MAFLRLLSTVPSALLAMLLGVIVLPTRSILLAIKSSLLPIVVTLSLYFLIPSALWNSLRNARLPLVLSAFIILLFIPISTALVSVIAALGVVYWTAVVLFDVFKNIWVGLKTGFLKGMSGFFEAYRQQESILATMLVRLGVLLFTMPDDAFDDMQFDRMRHHAGQFGDVIIPHQGLDVPDLESKDPIPEANLLKDEELSSAEELIKNALKLKIPVSAETKAEIKLATERLQQYKSLRSRLQDVKEALEQDNKDLIDDELMILDVTTPILLVQQYESEGKWYTVPNSPKITDKDHLNQWLKTKDTHPITRDSFTSPQLYNSQKTRYQWHELSKENCHSQALDDAANEVRLLLGSLPAKLKAAQEQTASPGTASQSLFGSTAVQNNNEIDINTSAYSII